MDDNNTSSKIQNCLSLDRHDWSSFGVHSIWYIYRMSRWRGVEEKQTHDHIYKSQPQVLSSKSDLKIPGLGINIYKVIDPTE